MEFNDDFLFVGDLHSQLNPTLRALDYANSKGLVPIFAGDIWDSRNEQDQTVEVARALIDYPNPLFVLQSNHQWKTMKWMKAERQILPDSFLTVMALELSELNVLPWLETMPIGMVVRSETTGREYRFCHAYFPATLPVNDCMIRQSEVNSKNRGKMLFGPRYGPNQERLEWWNRKPRATQDWWRVAGHYHVLTNNEDTKSIVIDSGCGEDGNLSGFNTKNLSIVDFGR